LIEDEANNNTSSDENNHDSDPDALGDSDDDGQLLDIEALRAREDSLTEKQRQMLNKIDGIRRQLKKLIDKKFKLKNQEELEFDDTKVKGELRGLDKRAQDLKD
jgi:hypothetical protein